MSEQEKTRYCKISLRIQLDEKFRSLSDDGKLLFFMMYTHPNITAVGALRANRITLAGEIGWDIERVSVTFGEGLAKGLWEADEKAPLIVFPNFPKHNQPDNPNVAKAWRKGFARLPECELKNRYYETVYNFLKGFGKGFAEGFAQTLPQTLPQTIGETESRKQKAVSSKETKTTTLPPRKKTFAPPVEFKNPTNWNGHGWVCEFLTERQKDFPLNLDYLFDLKWWEATSEILNGLPSREWLNEQFGRMKVWFLENPRRVPSAPGMRRFVRTWLERGIEQNRRKQQ
jgi:hypothetical protein